MENFNQLCVWDATIVGKDNIAQLTEFFKKELGVRIKYKCEIKTNPDLDNEGNPIPNTGNRNDLFFYIHDEDIMKFAVPRLSMGIRWWEDVIKYNDNSRHLYSEEFLITNPPTW